MNITIHLTIPAAQNEAYGIPDMSLIAAKATHGFRGSAKCPPRTALEEMKFDLASSLGDAGWNDADIQEALKWIKEPSKDHERFNGLSEGDSIRQFVSFELSPVRTNTDEEGGTSCEVTNVSQAEIWSIYGRLPSGEAMLIHDEDKLESAIKTLAMINGEWPVPLYYRSCNIQLPRPRQGAVTTMKGLSDAFDNSHHEVALALRKFLSEVL